MKRTRRRKAARLRFAAIAQHRTFMSRPSLYLITPVVEDAPAFAPLLASACATGLVAAVLLRLAPGDERGLVKAVKALAPAVQDQDTALIVADPGPGVDLASLVMRGGADGGHADDPARIEALIEGLKDGRSAGAGGLRTKHAAMTAGETGADYVLFGEPEPDGALPSLDLVEERAAWWADIFQTPCVAYAPSLDAVARLAATGAEFIALGEAVWNHPGGPAAALAEASRLLEPARDGAA